MSTPAAQAHRDGDEPRSLVLRLDPFAWEAVDQLGVPMAGSLENFVAFCVLYYLADADSGRIARQIGRSPYPGGPSRP